MSKKILTPLAAAFALSISAAPASAEVNPFGMTDLSAGYQQVAEGKCGGSKEAMKKGSEGKCGGAKEMEKNMEGKCGTKKSEKEGKCGEGKCGAQNKAKKNMEEGKCGGSKKNMEEGKCGGK